MPTPIVELQEQLKAKSAELHRIFEEAGEEMDFSKVKSIDGDTSAKAAEVRRRNDELTDLGKKYDEMADLVRLREANERRAKDLNAAGIEFVFPSGGQQQQQAERAKSLSEIVVAHPTWQQGVKAAKPNFSIEIPDFSMKALLSTTTGFAPANPRTATVVDFAVRRPMVADLVPQDNTTLSAIRYMEETTFVNNAAVVAEGGAKPEGALGWTERTVPVEVIAVWIPVTKQQLEDVSGIENLINNRLTLMLGLSEEIQLLTGNGTSPNLRGFLSATGLQTQAKGADPTPDAVYKAMTKIRATAFAEPSGVIFHPNDWQDIRLLRSADGIYIWGSPADAGPERIWGKPIVQTTAMTENTALTGDFQLYSHISRRMGVTIEVSDSHSDYFVRNLLAILAEMRESLEIYRGSAFAQITGI